MYALYIFLVMAAISATSIAPVEDRGPGTPARGSAPHSVQAREHRDLISSADDSFPTGPFPQTPTPGKAAKTTQETVIWSHRWTESLVSIRVTRDSGFRFTPGHYARLGIANPTSQTVFRPLSVASAPAHPHIEFFCTLIPGGDFSSRLAGLRIGDSVEVERASFGFLTVDSLAPGTDLWLLASGTGLAPFLSMLRDPGVWEAFDQLVVVHSVRRAVELAYADELGRLAVRPPAAAARATLHYLPVVTREPGASTLSERIPVLLASGRLAKAAGMALDPARSRIMACGNPDMTRELRALLGERGFRTTRRGARGQVAFEKYW